MVLVLFLYLMGILTFTSTVKPFTTTWWFFAMLIAVAPIAGIYFWDEWMKRKQD